MSVLFVFVDHFKVFNDTYGQAVDDRMLSAVAESIASAVWRSIDRAGGTVARSSLSCCPSYQQPGQQTWWKRFTKQSADHASPLRAQRPWSIDRERWLRTMLAGGWWEST
jgi:Diguanylate cyclase, GGDEF domain